MREDQHANTPTLRPGEGRHIWLNLHPEHWARLQDPAKWIDFLDDLYEALIELVGTNPCPHGKLEIREVPDLGTWARAWPDFIEWDSDVICAELCRINAGDVSWGIPHEISHVFDTQPACQFYMGSNSAINNNEQWANLKVVYAFEKLSGAYPGATAYIGHPPETQQRRLPIAEIGTEYFVHQYAQPYLSSERSMNHVRYLAETIGPRGSTTSLEAEAARYAAQMLRDSGL